MESSNSDSENECFESAEEGLEDEKDMKTGSDISSPECENERPANIPSHSNAIEPLYVVNEMSGNLMSYRKRPERVKRRHSKPSNKAISKSPEEPIFRPDKIVSDIFLQDITSNLSKNINRSLTTLQQTSSNVKELIFSTIPASNNNKGFSYDDKKVSSISAEKHFESVVGTGDHNKQKEETSQIKTPPAEINFSLGDGQNLNDEGSKLSNIGADNFENLNKVQKFDAKITVSENTVKKDYNLIKQKNLENSDKSLYSDFINKGIQDSSEHNKETTSNKVENSIGSTEGSLKSGNSITFKPDNQEHSLTRDNGVVVETKISFNENLENTKLDMNKEISGEPRVNEEAPGKEEGNILLQEIVSNSCMVQDNLTNSPASGEDNGNLVTCVKEDVNNISEEKPEIECTFNLKQLKTTLNNIINEERDGLKDIIENSSENFRKEDIFDKDMMDNETVKEGWDDFDFSDSEDKNVTFKQYKINVKEESKLLGNQQIKKNKDVLSDVTSTNNFDNNKEGKCADDILRKENFKTDSIKLSFEASSVSSDKSNVEDLKAERSLFKENKKHVVDNDIDIKPVSQDVWDWDTWDKEPENTQEMVKSETKTSKLKKPNNDLVDIGKWSGWDNFGQKPEEKTKNWSLGSWGVDMLLNKATTVTQGISNVLEAGLGAPDPESLARMEKMEIENIKAQKRDELKVEQQPLEVSNKNSVTSVTLFPVANITSLVAEVTSKIVEHSKIQEIGSKVINGGLDTLETFGKKTMEVLQEGDPGLKNKRAFLLGDEKPVLSQILREAREKADSKLKKAEEQELAKKCHFETLFDDFQGLVHLEALEMLSRQYTLKLDQLRSGMNSEEQEDLNSILDEVEQLCTLDEYDVDLKTSSKLDFKIKLQMATEPLKNEISIKRIIEIHDEVNNWLQTAETRSSFNIIKQKLVYTLAELTAATVQQFHKSGELLSVKECRKTVEEVDSLLRLTNVLCAEIDMLCEKFISLAKEISKEINGEEMNSLSENVTVVTKNSTSYIRQAFNLLVPVLQFGAAAY